MESHRKLNDKEFEVAFATCSLPAADFTHEAHLQLAFIHIDQYGIDQTLKQVKSKLKTFVINAGAEDKYNETVTIAAIKTVEHFMNKSTARNFQSFLEEFPRLKSDFTALIDQHYDFNIFNSAAARQFYIEPTIAPFDR